MTEVEYILNNVSAENAQIIASPCHIRIIHKCGCILTQTSRKPDYAELCLEHRLEYSKLAKSNS